MATPFNFSGFGNPASSTTAATSQPSFGSFTGFGSSATGATSQTTAAGFGQASLTTTQTAGGFGQTKTTAGASLLAAELSSSAVTTGVAVTTSATLKLSTPATGFASLTSTTSSGFGTAGFKPLSLSSATTTTTTTGLSFSMMPPTSTATTASTTCATTTMTYKDLEEAVNKWTIEMEAEEQIFLEQATQVNAWDQLLMENGEKISSLNSEVEHLKLDQERLEHELDFILSQQRELEDILVPLERSMEQVPAAAYSQNTDVERERIYKLSECVDSKLKQIASDLKEIVEFLNSSDASRDTNEPVVLIAKILNAHMDSLQWIDHSTSNLQYKVESVNTQIERLRKQQELKF